MKLSDLDFTKEFEWKSCKCIISEIEEKIGKNNNKYIAVTLTENRSKVVVNVFPNSGEYSKICGEKLPILVDIVLSNTAQDGNLWPKMLLYAHIEGNIEEYFPTVKVNTGRVFNIFDKFSKSNSEYERITRQLWDKYYNELEMGVAAVKKHHFIRGELLLHLVEVAEIAYNTAIATNFANADLCLAGALLHDIGKVYEMRAEAGVEPKYTLEGTLEGHLYKGMQMVEEVGNGSKESIYIKHCIAAHHGVPEWGAIQTPKFIEARIVHYADMISSRMYVEMNGMADLKVGEILWLHGQPLVKIDR